MYACEAVKPCSTIALAITLAIAVLLGPGCNEPQHAPERPQTGEVDHQVNRLRDDTELEMHDLRGRWLAAEGLLTRQKLSLDEARQAIKDQTESMETRLVLMEIEFDSVRAQLEAAKTEPAPAVDESKKDRLNRLARSYEELHCLRRRGAEEDALTVYLRYGFEDADEWGAAWREAARSEAFEEEVSARVERLCP